MKHSAKIRFVLTIGFALSTLAPAQTIQQPPPNRAQVTYNGGKLSVSANNSSLNQILHDIARETGMKITGGVTDERVFGQYGPDAPSRILNTLLDGTGSNMLLVQATSANPAELILTPRHGGPTPPIPAPQPKTTTFRRRQSIPCRRGRHTPPRRRSRVQTHLSRQGKRRTAPKPRSRSTKNYSDCASNSNNGRQILSKQADFQNCQNAWQRYP